VISVRDAGLKVKRMAGSNTLVGARPEVAGLLGRDPVPVSPARAHADRRVELAAKRLIDIVGASVALVLLSPVIGIVALAIAVGQGRPILFRQSRAGLEGRPFSIAKFRTMQVGADAERDALRALNEVTGSAAAFKLTADPRVTRLGRFLRRTSLDELPQLWNVVRGEMSLVGPRPHPFDDVARYEPWHFRRLSVKPGITGLWQISARADADFDRWVALDLEYIDTWSVPADVNLALRTIPALVRAEGR
jgi:lipopolysaccharide/colanic/teichoic acid biosynthesis glycosyltransferase